jgi:hypothetical protein
MVSYDPYTAQQLLEMSTSSTSKNLSAEANFELEKSKINSYEEGWDRWDGPMWPKDTIQCELRKYIPFPLPC